MPLDNPTAGQYTPTTNDVLLRHLIMQYYTDTIEYGVTLRVWMNSSKATRHGIIDRKGIPYRIGFLRLFSMTRYIKSVSDAPIAKEIEGWMNMEYKADWNEKQKEHYFKIGLRLSDRWTKLLIEQSIINFS